MTMAPASVAIPHPQGYCIRSSVWGCRLIHGIGMPRPEYGVRPRYNPHTFFISPNQTASRGDFDEATGEIIMLRKSIMTAGLILGLAMNGAASDGLTYFLNYNDLTCTVSCVGDDEVSGSVTIPDYYDGFRVIGIRENAFYGNDKITSITISDNVEYIGERAFTGCINLKSIKLPYNLKSIARNAFDGDYQYSGCSPETVYLDNVAGWCELNIIGGDFSDSYGNPLSGAEHLIINGEETTTLEIPEGVERIGNRAFSNTYFTEVKFPSTLKRIEFRAFGFCHQLESLDFPDTLESIEMCSFEDCYNIKNISFGKGIKYIGRAAFYSYNEELSIYSVSCPDMETWLGIEFGGIESLSPGELFDYFKTNPLQYAQHFYINGQEITDLVIPAGTEEIKPMAFYGGKMFTSLSLPESIIAIGDYSFYNCPFTTLNLPAGLKYIGKYAFNGCAATILNIPEDTYIGEYAFSGWKNLTTVTIPTKMTAIPAGIFYGCTSLTSVKLHDGVTDIGDNAFSYCGINEISLPSSIENIGSGAFSWTNLSEIKIPEQVTVIEPRTFEYCNNLKNIELPQGLKEIKKEAFRWSNLSFIKIPEGVTSIEENTFYGCSLKSVEIPQGLKSIGSWSFKKCVLLKRIDLPESLENMGGRIFDGVKLEEIHCKGTTLPNAHITTFQFESGEKDYIYNNAVLYVPVGSLEAYKGHDVWGKFADIREEGVSEVAAVGVSAPSVEVGADGIRVDTPNDDAHVEVYSIAGTRCYSGAAGAISLPQGCYVVVVNGTAHKVVIR